MIRAIQWSDAAAKGLARALPGPVLDIVANEVRRGQSVLFHCKSDVHEAYCVTRIDDNPSEFVIVAFEGSGTMEFLPLFVKTAQSYGIPMRLHTVSPVVARLVRKVGFEYNPRNVEMILRRGV